MLLYRNMTVTICHSHTKIYNMEHTIVNSDLVVCSAGKPFLDCSDRCFYNKPIVIDVGINFDNNGKLVGDCFNKYEDCTPVPGGVGLLTRLGLLENVVESYKIKNGEK